MPEVSVIVPIYNVEKYLSKCIDSIINQTFKDIEIICVNDGSTDNSLKILEKYALKESRIKIINQKHLGPSSARNAGLNAANGEYIVFVDSDDWVENNLVELAYNKISAEKADVVIYSYNNVEEGEAKPFEYVCSVLKYYEKKNINFTDLISINHCIWDRMFRKKFLTDNNIKFPDKITCNEDGFFNLLCLFYNAKYCCLPEILYNYLCTRKGSIMADALHIIRDNIYTCKYFISSDIYKNASDKFKAAVLNTFLNNLNYKYSQEKYRLYRPIYNYQLAKFFKYLSETVDKDILKSTPYPEMVKKHSNIKYFLNHLFSIENIYKKSIKIKQITLCFWKFKFKINHNKSDKKEIKRFNNNPIGKNSILIVEANVCHGETISGYAKMFSELGYDVDIITTPEVYQEKPFCRLEKQYYQNIYSISGEKINKALCLSKIKDYKHIFFNSYQLYYNNTFRDNTITIFEFFDKIVSPQNGFLALEHHLDKIDTDMCKEKRIIQLGNIRPNVVFCNSHYYGKFEKHEKNNITQFIIVGSINAYRKNFDLLIKSAKELLDKNVENFHINIIGSGKIIIPKRLQKNISCLGRLSFDEMFNYVEKSDFILALLDPDDDTHLRYLEDGTSGTFQLSYGFCKPILIHSKFAKKHYYNESNSVIYHEDFTKSLEKCINMSNTEYSNCVENLKNTIQEIENTSIKNLKEVLTLHNKD